MYVCGNHNHLDNELPLFGLSLDFFPLNHLMNSFYMKPLANYGEACWMQMYSASVMNKLLLLKREKIIIMQ